MLPTFPASSALGCKSVGLIFARPEQVFNLVMDLGPERASWDLTHARGEVVGMNTFLREDLHGLGFAIASGRIREAALELLGVEVEVV